MVTNTWQVQQAKQQLSRLVKAAEAGEPQYISRHGEAVVVVIDVAEYRAIRGPRPSFKEWLLSAPKAPDFELSERTIEPERDLGL